MNPTQETVLRILRENGPTTIPDLCRRMGRAKCPVYKACRKLERDGLVRVAGIADDPHRPFIWEAVE